MRGTGGCLRPPELMCMGHFAREGVRAEIQSVHGMELRFRATQDGHLCVRGERALLPRRRT